jgi:hypothetical protein
MKQRLLLSLIFFTGTISAQITIDQGDMPSIGDNIPRKSDTMSIHTGPGGSGPNQTWNFTATSLSVINENTSIVSVASTPNANQFSSSNLAMTNDNASYLYFNKSAQSFTTQGFSGDLLGTGIINAVFNPALTLHQFPRTFGSTFTDTYGINVTIPGASINPLINQINYRRSSVVKDTTDAWGQLTTPFGTYDVLRVHSMEIFTDSILALPIFPPAWQLVSVTIDTTHSYSWLGKGGKLAIAEMSFDSLGVPKIFKWTELPGLGVGITAQNHLGLSIYPNPASEVIQIEINEHTSLDENVWHLYDHLGSLVHEETFSPFLTKKEINVQSFSAGIYSWELRSEKNKSFQRGKIAIIR